MATFKDTIYGTCDSNTERFYYVTDLDSDTAVLIYYSNISEGDQIT